MITEKILDNDKSEMVGMWFFIGVIGGLLWIFWSVYHDGFWYDFFSSKAFSYGIRIFFWAVGIIIIGYALYRTILYFIHKEIFKNTPPAPAPAPVVETVQEEEEEEPKSVTLMVDQTEIVLVEKGKGYLVDEAMMNDFQNKMNFATIKLIQKYHDKGIQINGSSFDKYDDSIIGAIYYSYQMDIPLGGEEDEGNAND